jgi:dienelactone hydrolase
MSQPLHLATEREPLGFWLAEGEPVAERPALRAHAIEFASRGDRVTGRVIRPHTGGPAPLVLAQHALGDSAHGLLDAFGTRFTPEGVAVAAIDFPLHGARADQKLLRRLGERRAGDAIGAALAAEFAQQALVDLQRALDALCALSWVDAKRVAYVGFGLGGQLGSVFCALDPRPAAAALAPGVGAALEGGPDPAAYLGRIAPRPLLRVEQPPAAAAASIAGFLASHLAPR